MQKVSFIYNSNIEILKAAPARGGIEIAPKLWNILTRP